MHVAIYGAGSIGCYVGGRLLAGGADVTLIGRQRIGDTLARHGLSLSDYRGRRQQLAPDAISFSTDPRAVANADAVLICVKSAATEEVAQSLAADLKPGCLVISLQNGLGNAELLARHLPGVTVLAGMVPYNVVNAGDGHFHQGSQGELEVQDHAALAPLAAAFAAADIPLLTHPDMLPVLWAKLLLNLNNPVNALSDLPLKSELSQRAFRRCVALAQTEALHWLAVAGIRPARLTPIPPRWMPRLLNVPDWLFKRLANRMLEIDPQARSSMWEDLQAGRRTEIDWINGEVVRLAASHGGHAPVNARLIERIREAEAGERVSWQGHALLADLRQAAQLR